jgi:CelD/BcsL family acetyltransferase involved in cellulose biosynthesis
MNISIISSFSDFLDLQDEWDKIVMNCSDSTPFQSFTWNFNWWKYLRGKKKLSILICKEGEEVKGIFPMWLRRLTEDIKILEFIGTRGTDYLGPLVPYRNYLVYEAVFKHMCPFGTCA